MQNPDPEYDLHYFMLSTLFVFICYMNKTLPHSNMSTLTGKVAPKDNEMLSHSVIVSSEHQ